MAVGVDPRTMVMASGWFLSQGGVQLHEMAHGIGVVKNDRTCFVHYFNIICMSSGLSFFCHFFYHLFLFLMATPIFHETICNS